MRWFSFEADYPLQDKYIKMNKELKVYVMGCSRGNVRQTETERKEILP